MSAPARGGRLRRGGICYDRVESVHSKNMGETRISKCQSTLGCG